MLMLLVALSNPDFAIRQAAQAEGIPYELLRAVCTIESHLNPAAIHHDDGGGDSLGLCQLKLSTAHMMGYRGNAKGLLNASDNSKYAAKYLRHQLDRYPGSVDYGVAAYNSGSVLFNRKHQIINRSYVIKVLKEFTAQYRVVCL